LLYDGRLNYLAVFPFALAINPIISYSFANPVNPRNDSYIEPSCDMEFDEGRPTGPLGGLKRFLEGWGAARTNF